MRVRLSGEHDALLLAGFALALLTIFDQTLGHLDRMTKELQAQQRDAAQGAPPSLPNIHARKTPTGLHILLSIDPRG